MWSEFVKCILNNCTWSSSICCKHKSVTQVLSIIVYYSEQLRRYMYYHKLVLMCPLQVNALQLLNLNALWWGSSVSWVPWNFSLASTYRPYPDDVTHYVIAVCRPFWVAKAVFGYYQHVVIKCLAMVKSCCVPGCENRWSKGSSLSFYHFPADPAWMGHCCEKGEVGTYRTLVVMQRSFREWK